MTASARISGIRARACSRQAEALRRLGEKRTLARMAEEEEEAAGEARALKERSRKACVLVMAIAEAARRDLRGAFGEVATQALRSVLGPGYALSVAHEVRADRTQAHFGVVSAEHRTPRDPMTSRGGGVVDVVAFALRVVTCEIVGHRGPLVLDEPFRYVSPELVEAAARFAKEVSARFGRQVILVTHQRELAEAADHSIKIA